MSAFTLAMVFLGGLAFDVGVNATQNWYDVVYADAFWSHRVTDSAALRQVSREELEIDRLMRGQDFVARRAAGEAAPTGGKIGDAAPGYRIGPQSGLAMQVGAPPASQ